MRTFPNALVGVGELPIYKRVLTSLALKAIESIRPGDKVLAAASETGRQEEKKELYAARVDKKYA